MGDRSSIAQAKPSKHIISSIYGGASTYAKTYNTQNYSPSASQRQSWSPQSNKLSQSSTHQSRKSSLISSHYPEINEEDEDEESNPNNSYNNYIQYNEDEGPSAAFLSVESDSSSNPQIYNSNENLTGSILFSKPLDGSTSSLDETPHASLYVNNSDQRRQRSDQASTILKPPPQPFRQPSFFSNLRQSVNMASTLSTSLGSSAQNGSAELESIQLTQTLNESQINRIRGQKPKTNLYTDKRTILSNEGSGSSTPRGGNGIARSRNNDDEPPIDLAVDLKSGGSAPHTSLKNPLDHFHNNVLPGMSVPFDPEGFMPKEVDLEAQNDYAIDSDTDDEGPHASQSPFQNEPDNSFLAQDFPRHDVLWGNIYLGLISMMFATSLIIWLRTEVPLSTGPKPSPIRDTMYTMLQKSGRFFAFDIIVASAASIVWVFLLKRYSLILFYASIVTVPLCLTGLSVYPMVMSYRSTYGGNTTQDRAMRWTTIVPLAMAGFWCWFIYTGRSSLNRALGIIKLASSILSDNPPLIVLGYATVGSFTIASWVWMHMFTRLFLNGHATNSSGGWVFVLDTQTWILASFYTFMYLWSWGVVSGFQRATISAVVSQWYFYRNAFPQPLASDMTLEALQYSIGSQFGTICLSALLRLAVRLPLYVLPKRAMGYVQLAIYSVLPASVLALTNPLALSNAIINSQGLVESAQSISSLKYLDQGHNNPMEAIDKIGRRMSVGGRRMSSIDSTLGTTEQYIGGVKMDRRQHSWTAYRLAKMLLSAARGLVSLALGYGAWIHAARSSDGSLYGYAAGLMAGFIGWFVLGASEGVLSMVVDASFLCFAIDNAAKGGHCTEADRQFGGM